jgi:hypothetical protein
MEGPIQVKELGDMAPKLPAAQISPKSDRLSFEAVFGILSSFTRKAVNTKIEDNFMAHDQDTQFAFFGVVTLSYGPPWAHYLGGYQDRLLGGPLGLPGLRYTAPEGVEHKE